MFNYEKLNEFLSVYLVKTQYEFFTSFYQNERKEWFKRYPNSYFDDYDYQVFMNKAVKRIYPTNPKLQKKLISLIEITIDSFVF